jgi:ubiquinone/menaquinone biosynthesis C-methylase UbiE
MEYLAPKPGDIVLDVGSGGGQYAVELARTGAVAIAVDIASDFVCEASTGLCLVKGATACVGDATGLPFRNCSSDAVLLSGTIQNTDVVGVLRECARVLKPGGRVVVTGLEKHPYVDEFYSRARSLPIKVLIRACRLPTTAEAFADRYRKSNGVLRYVDRESISSCAEAFGLSRELTVYVPGGAVCLVTDLLHLFTLRSRRPWAQSRVAFIATYPIFRALQMLGGQRKEGSEWIAAFRRAGAGVSGDSI